MTSQRLHYAWKASAGVRGQIIGSALCGMLRITAAMCFVWACKQLIDIATMRHEGSFTLYVAIMVTCAAVQLTASVLTSRIESLATVKMRNNLRQELFSHLMAGRYLGRPPHTGDLINRIQEDSQTLAAMACMLIPSIAVSLIQFIAAYIFLSALDIHLAWILALVMPVTLLAGRTYIKRIKRLTHDIRAIDSKTQELIQEHLQHCTLLRTMESTRNSDNALDTLHSSLRQSVRKRTRYALSLRACMQAGFMAGYMVAFLWGAHGIMAGYISFGIMTAFLQLVAQLQRPVVDIAQKSHSVAQALASVERMAALFDLPKEENGTPIRLNKPVGLRFEHVDFSYIAGTAKTVCNFSYDFKPGTTTAILGESGMGKTTLIRLALALIEPDKGHIILYNADKEIKASPMTRCNITYVPQGNSLMSGSIRDNLLLGNPTADMADMERALRGAAADFVADLPDGIYTLCGEKGVGLSEGQAQRIAIARGLLRNGSIMLLDEPSSSLDAATEVLLFERLKDYMKGKTFIVVTHRDSVSHLCNNIIRIRRN